MRKNGSIKGTNATFFEKIYPINFFEKRSISPFNGPIFTPRSIYKPIQVNYVSVHITLVQQAYASVHSPGTG